VHPPRGRIIRRNMGLLRPPLAITPDNLSPDSAEEAYRQLVDQLTSAGIDWTTAGFVAIANGGCALGTRLHAELAPAADCGLINAAFHRDDIGLKPIPGNFRPTDLPFDIDGRLILLVDDVFASGRTLRAALNELFDHGRPARVLLAVLADTAQRALPLIPDFCGARLPLAADRTLVVDLAPAQPARFTFTIR
jgi:pyrimidine operon attenuation protein / uracil phosphoribosyltransferase